MPYGRRWYPTGSDPAHPPLRSGGNSARGRRVLRCRDRAGVAVRDGGRADPRKPVLQGLRPAPEGASSGEMRYKCIAAASSGIAATLLKEGRTAHSFFRIPIPVLNTSTCNVKLDTKLGKL